MTADVCMSMCMYHTLHLARCIVPSCSLALHPSPYAPPASSAEPSGTPTRTWLRRPTAAACNGRRCTRRRWPWSARGCPSTGGARHESGPSTPGSDDDDWSGEELVKSVAVAPRRSIQAGGVLICPGAGHGVRPGRGGGRVKPCRFYDRQKPFCYKLYSVSCDILLPDLEQRYFMLFYIIYGYVRGTVRARL